MKVVDRGERLSATLRLAQARSVILEVVGIEKERYFVECVVVVDFARRHCRSPKYCFSHRFEW